MDDNGLKRCGRCKKRKPPTTDHFYRDRSRKDGLRPICKVCAKFLITEWRHSESGRAWTAATRQRDAGYAATWRPLNADHLHAYARLPRTNLIKAMTYYRKQAEHHRAKLAAAQAMLVTIDDLLTETDDQTAPGRRRRREVC
jgi:hypothetical protein